MVQIYLSLFNLISILSDGMIELQYVQAHFYGLMARCGPIIGSGLHVILIPAHFKS